MGLGFFTFGLTMKAVGWMAKNQNSAAQTRSTADLRSACSPTCYPSSALPPAHSFCEH